MAELYLNYAEAANEAYGPDGSAGGLSMTALDAVNEVRNRAGMPDVLDKFTGSAPLLRERIRNERCVELAFEGHRLFDIRRWRIAEQVMNGEVYGATPPGADDRYLAQTRVFNPNRDYLWPIPVGEMNTNTAMEQNPGY